MPIKKAQKRCDVLVLLQKAGAEQYYAQFLRSGFDDLVTLKDADDADLKDLGLPPFLVARVRKQLQELLTPQGAYDASHPLVRFLEDVGLGQYTDIFMRNGFDDLDILYEVDDADLKDLGIPRGHALKLKKRLRELQLDACHHAVMYAPPAHAHGSGARGGHQPTLKTRAPHTKLHQGPTLSLHSQPTEPMMSAVERSWEKVQVRGTAAVGEILYRNLFRVMPEAAQLFPSHVRAKYREWSADELHDESSVFESPGLRKLFSKFINAVGCAVAGLHDNSKLVAMLLQLGHRHAKYGGVSEAHFQALGKAFAWTLREVMGSEFTREIEDAWAMTYSFMTSIMLEGSRMNSAAELCEAMENTCSTAPTTPGSDAARAADAAVVAE